MYILKDYKQNYLSSRLKYEHQVYNLFCPSVAVSQAYARDFKFLSKVCDCLKTIYRKLSANYPPKRAQHFTKCRAVIGLNSAQPNLTHH